MVRLPLINHGSTAAHQPWFDCRSSTIVRLPLINHAIDKASGIILAWHNGGRIDADFRQLLKYLQKIPIDLYYSDHWGAYTRNLPENCHYTGKNQTWKIERKKLNFRIHLKRLNRKTICYSKSEEVHDNVIGMYIERYYFKTGLFRNSA